ncbi:AMP-binding protein [Terrabacter sp. 2RAF25]|uniref:AMP-binding protein n=1 Tax=Terrabacter sp. 2RAF25 TaxID=3232998 RepID=UPI003F9A4D36
MLDSLTIPTTAPPGAPWLALPGDSRADAVVLVDRSVSRAELRALVDDAGRALTGTRRLVLVAMENRLEPLVAYLAALRQGHAVLLAAGDRPDVLAGLRAAWDPDIEVSAEGAVQVHRVEPAAPLHPDLALLLSTSGSTGSPKLVRLSYANLTSNAEQIAEFLQIRETDCAATTLPLHYCYGLSVLHSHLARGAGIALTDLAVVDECFWNLARRAGVTSLAGVPWTFEMLERSGFAGLDLPHLRYITQAGGRLDPDRVQHWARLGRESGWDFFVMYGQTEATARMAYLPPDLALTNPGSIGVPVPGGALEVVDGELHYTGPNVMLGYAERPADLALGRTTTRLRTGDLGRVGPDGLYEVTGRSSRHVKVLGHRVDLDVVERRLREAGRDVRVAGREGLVAVSVRAAGASEQGGVDQGAVRRAAATAGHVPLGAVHVVEVGEHPTLVGGKVDLQAIVALADRSVATSTAADSVAADGGSVARMYAAALHRDAVPADATFTTLGGDSLSYVEVSLRLEALLGDLPPSWHVTPVGRLQDQADAALAERGATGRAATDVGQESEAEPGAHDGGARTQQTAYGRVRRALLARRRTVETSVWLRALAIVLIVGTHSDLFSLQGTANALLVLVGFNVARFALATSERAARLEALGRGLVRIVVPTLAVIVPAHVLLGDYQTRNLFLLNWAFGEQRLGPPWRFWFIEALAFALVVAIVLTAVPGVPRLEKRWPFGLPAGLTLAAFTLRLPLFELPVPRMQGSALVVLFLFFLGWAIARGTTPRQRWAVTVAAVGMVGTFSGNPARDALSLALVLALVWKPTTRLPAWLVPAVQVLAASSLFVYVIHWQVLEHLWGRPVLAFVGSMAVGVAYWLVWTRALPCVGDRLVGGARLSLRRARGGAPVGSTQRVEGAAQRVERADRAAWRHVVHT